MATLATGGQQVMAHAPALPELNDVSLFVSIFKNIDDASTSRSGDDVLPSLEVTHEHSTNLGIEIRVSAHSWERVLVLSVCFTFTYSHFYLLLKPDL